MSGTAHSGGDGSRSAYRSRGVRLAIAGEHSKRSWNTELFREISGSGSNWCVTFHPGCDQVVACSCKTNPGPRQTSI